MFILYRLSRSKGLSCFMQFAKECNYFRVICLFFWHFITNKRRSSSQDWIILFLLSFYLRILFHAMFFVLCIFSPNKIFLTADILQILKSWKQKLTVFDSFLIHGWKKCSKVIEHFFTKNTLENSSKLQ